MTSLDIMERLAGDTLSEAMVKRFEQIRRQVRYLDAQLNEVSSFNRSHQSQIILNLEQTYVIDLTYILIEDITKQYDDYPPIQIVTDLRRSDSYLLDAQLVQHIVSNLIYNAVKYSNGQGEITIRIDCDAETFQFEVTDEGIGIPEADRDNVFNFFYRAENVGYVKGTGIGLAVVKQSVMAHGGTIDFESDVGVGSTFRVSLPIANT